MILAHKQKDMEHLMYLIKAFAVSSAVAMVTYLMPLKDFIGITFFMVAADLITGVQAAKTRGEAVHSKGFRRSVTKFVMYVCAILGAHAMQDVYFKDFPMVVTISCYIAGTEFYSVLENVGTVTGTDVLSAVKNKLMDIIKPKNGRD